MTLKGMFLSLFVLGIIGAILCFTFISASGPRIACSLICLVISGVGFYAAKKYSSLVK